MDLDRYYTPDHVADRLLTYVDSETLDHCVDSACGDGSLLRAAKRAFKTVTCGGIDKDGAAIRRLRKAHPEWLLSVADVLSPAIGRAVGLFDYRAPCDLLALNPPFSLRQEKSVSVSFRGEVLRSSVAMAHILRSAELFCPSMGAIAIVPESLLFSDTDDLARRRLAKYYRVSVVAELRNTTFRGARANAAVVRLTPEASRRVRARRNGRAMSGVRLVRGGLPVFESTADGRGLPYVHTTDVLRVASESSLRECRR